MTSLIGRTLGGGNVKLADNVAWHGVVISFIYGVLATGLGLHYIDFLANHFGSTRKLLPSAENICKLFYGDHCLPFFAYDPG